MIGQESFKKLLLKTAFSCMACDGDIDDQEVDLIRTLAKDQIFFGDIDLSKELNQLVEAINENGHVFLKNYFVELTAADLSEEMELSIIEVAIKVI